MGCGAIAAGGSHGRTGPPRLVGQTHLVSLHSCTYWPRGCSLCARLPSVCHPPPLPLPCRLPGNVLLTASDKDTRGFTAKVVDFGLSRVCSGDYLRTRTLGCAEYM